MKKENGRGFFLPRGILIFAFRLHYCYTYRIIYAGAAQGKWPEGQERVLWSIPVPRNSFAGADYPQPVDKISACYENAMGMVLIKYVHIFMARHQKGRFLNLP